MRWPQRAIVTTNAEFLIVDSMAALCLPALALSGLRGVVLLNSAWASCPVRAWLERK
jgi:hypothetical protein